MTPEQKAKLLELAQAAIQVGLRNNDQCGQEWDDYADGSSPETILSLLDENERLIKRVERLTKALKTYAELDFDTWGGIVLAAREALENGE